LHAAAIADELEVARVVIPHLPGSFSAAGMLHGGIQHDLVQAFFRDQRGAERDLDIAVDALRQRGLDMLRAENVPLDEAYVRFFVDVRYAGQEFSMTVPLREGAPFHVLIDDFQTLYHGRYGHSSPGSGIEVVAVRTRVGRHFEQHSSQDEPPTSGGPTENQLVHFADGSRLSPVHHREHVLELGGPALIIESTSTTLLPPHWRAERLVGGHLLLHRNGAS
jgi:N-methylhydantoinase A